MKDQTSKDPNHNWKEPSVENFREVLKGPWEKVDRTDFKVEICHKKKAIYITGQSSNYEDWPDNFDFRKRRLYELMDQKPEQWFPDRDDIWVHSGFLAQYKPVRRQLIDILKQYPEYAVYIGGWSLGGSWTQLLLEEVWHRWRNKRVIVFFGYATGNAFRNLPKEYREGIAKCSTFVYCWWDPVTWMRVLRFYRYGKNIRIGKWWRIWPFQHCTYQIERALKEKFGGP